MQWRVVDNRYTLGELLGSGGMARVYLARDEVLDRNVALKVLREQYVDDEKFIERFRQEARNAAGLSHPNIVPVHDWGRSENDTYYMAMECVPRGTLKEWILEHGPLEPDAAIGVALQIADALQAAHEKGVIHRDIKPQNVLVTASGDVKVADFGISRAADSSTATTTGFIFGTAGYMSPEHVKGEPVGPRSDLYSLGVVLYEMLTGDRLYEADGAVAVAIKHISEPPRSPRESNPSIPEALDALTVKLLAKNPEERPANAAALANDLQRIRSGLRPAGAEPGKPGPVAPPLPAEPEEQTSRTAIRPSAATPFSIYGRGRRRWRRLFSALAMLLLSTALIGGLTWTSSQGLSVAQPKAGKVSVPGLTYAPEAKEVLSEAGLKLGRRDEVPSGSVPKDSVIAQDPIKGTEAEPDTTVSIIVSTGPESPEYDEKQRVEEGKAKGKQKAEKK